MSDKTFANGIYFNLPHERAPDFVIGRISISPTHFIDWLRAQDGNDKGYVNLQVKKAKDGKPYVELDTWKPKDRGGDRGKMADDDLDVPF